MNAEAKKQLASQVVANVGGKENISSALHCMTRLRLNVKDKSRVNVDAISNLKGVIGAQWSGDQFQVIIGQEVGDVYKELVAQTGIASEAAVNENLDEKKKGFSFGAIIDAISGCLIPAIPIVTGAGMLKVVLIFATMFGWMGADSPTYQVLSFASDAGFYFLPVFIGAFAAKKFNTNIGLGMLLGAILLHPTFVSNVSAGTAMSIFGLPIYAASYGSTIFPSILAVFVMKYVYDFFTKYVPTAVKVILVPLLTILVMLPLTLCAIGPAGSFIGIYLAKAIMWLYNTVGFLGVGVLAGLYPVMVITGTHGALFPPMMQALTTLGYDPIVGMAGVMANLCQGAATLAVGVKNKDERSNAISCAITAIFGGVTEPAMFGINLKYKTPLYAVIGGGFIGGCIAGLLKVYMYALGGSAGIFGFAGFVGPDSTNLINFFISIVIGMVATFILTMILYKPEEK